MRQKIFLAACVLMLYRNVAAKDKLIERDRFLEIPVGISQTVHIPNNVDKIIVSDDAICNVVRLSAGQLLLTAKTVGETQVTMSSREYGTMVLRVSARTSLANIQKVLKEIFPSETTLQAKSAAGVVYLSGTVADATVAETAHRLVTDMLLVTNKHPVEVINLTTIAANQQVQVRMRFVEISRSNLRSMGFNAWFNGPSQYGGLASAGQPFNSINNATAFNSPPASGIPPGTSPTSNFLPILTSPIAGAMTLAFSGGTGSFPISATLSLLEQYGLSKTLTEPTLVAMSGQPAKFLVGGEFPIPIPDALGHVLIQFKSYGAQLAFTPTVLGQETVSLAINAEVSDIDKSNGVITNGASVPGLSSRQSSTVIRLRDGQSFAIAGLLSDKITASNAKIPLLGDFPVIGSLFRTVNYTRSELELVILVSIRIVKPVESNEIQNIFNEDEFNDPNDIEFFLLGTVDKTHVATKNRLIGGPDGAVGFSR